jgi:hypothetical protein
VVASICLVELSGRIRDTEPATTPTPAPPPPPQVLLGAPIAIAPPLVSELPAVAGR